MKDKATLLFTLAPADGAPNWLVALRGRDEGKWRYEHSRTWWAQLFGADKQELPYGKKLYGKMTISRCSDEEATATVKLRNGKVFYSPVLVWPHGNGFYASLWCPEVTQRLWGNDLPPAEWTPVKVDFEYEILLDSPKETTND